MCEEIDRQVLRKYDIESKLGKGVRYHHMCCQYQVFLELQPYGHLSIGFAGIWHSVESDRQEDPSDYCIEENL